MPRKLGIMLITDEKNLFACGTMVMNILDKINRLDEIRIYHTGLDSASVSALKKIDGRISLVDYTVDKLKSVYTFINDETLKNDFFKRFTYLTALKFYVFGMLEEFEQAILLDTDMLITEALDELINMKEYDVIWGKDNGNLQGKLAFFGCRNIDNICKSYGHYSTPNGGFIILNRTFDYKKAFSKGEWFLKQACINHPAIICETSLGYIVNSMDLKTKDVDRSVYNVAPPNFNGSAKLLHFLTPGCKPWISPAMQYAYPQWVSYFKAFTEASGMKFENIKIFAKQGEYIFNQRYAHAWEELFSNMRMPEELMLFSTLFSKKTKFYLDSLLYFELELQTWMGNRFSASLRIDKRISRVIDDAASLIGKSLLRQDSYLFTDANDYYEYKLDVNHIDDVPYLFNIFYELCSDLLANIRSAYRVPANGLRIKTFFGKYLVIKNGFLAQDERITKANAIVALIHEDLVALRCQDGRYIRGITKAGQTLLSLYPSFFKTVKGNSTIRIIVQDQYLSARDDKAGSVRLMPFGREWEEFKLIP